MKRLLPLLLLVSAPALAADTVFVNVLTTPTPMTASTFCRKGTPNLLMLCMG